VSQKVIIEGTLEQDTKTGEILVLKLNADEVSRRKVVKPGVNNPVTLNEGLHLRFFSRDKTQKHDLAQRLLATGAVKITIEPVR
jgi:hypothetical protein